MIISIGALYTNKGCSCLHLLQFTPNLVSTFVLSKRPIKSASKRFFMKTDGSTYIRDLGNLKPVTFDI